LPSSAQALAALEARYFDQAVKKERMSAPQAQQARALLATSTDIAASGQADLVIGLCAAELAGGPNGAHNSQNEVFCEPDANLGLVHH